MFVAVAILQLAETGKLNLDDPVGVRVPEYANKEFASKVTIRYLLAHRGGAGGLPNQEVRATLRSVDDYMSVLGGRPPIFEPGTDHQYSNYGYMILEAIVERVSGMPFNRYASARIFSPAGMTATHLRASDELARTRAQPYRRANGSFAPADSWSYSVGDRLVTAYSTSRDLLRFAEALQAGRLISRATLAAALQPLPGQLFALGFIIRDEGKLQSYGHGGTSAGVNADVRIVPRLGYVVIGLSNFDPPAAERLVDFFINRMPVD